MTCDVMLHVRAVGECPVSRGSCGFPPPSPLLNMQTELDGYVAAECVLCGDMMVQSVDKPLVTEEEQAEQSHQWAL